MRTTKTEWVRKLICLPWRAHVRRYDFSRCGSFLSCTNKFKCKIWFSKFKRMGYGYASTSLIIKINICHYANVENNGNFERLVGYNLNKNKK